MEQVLEAIELGLYLEELAKTYSGNPLFLVELKEFVDTINESEKLLVYLRLLGYGTLEIAEYLGVSDRTIRYKLERIRKKAIAYIG